LLLVINSNFGPISHRLRDMASFPLKSAHFPTPPFYPQFEIFPLHNFACLGLRHEVFRKP